MYFRCYLTMCFAFKNAGQAFFWKQGKLILIDV